jgi:hypothetical protein
MSILATVLFHCAYKLDKHRRFNKQNKALLSNAYIRSTRLCG